MSKLSVAYLRTKLTLGPKRQIYRNFLLLVYFPETKTCLKSHIFEQATLASFKIITKTFSLTFNLYLSSKSPVHEVG